MCDLRCVCVWYMVDFAMAARIVSLHISIVNFSFENTVLKGAFLLHILLKSLLVAWTKQRFTVKTVERSRKERKRNEWQRQMIESKWLLRAYWITCWTLFYRNTNAIGNDKWIAIFTGLTQLSATILPLLGLHRSNHAYTVADKTQKREKRTICKQNVFKSAVNLFVFATICDRLRAKVQSRSSKM